MVVTAYEPTLLDSTPALRVYDLECSSTSFHTDVIPQQGALERAPEEYAALASAGIYKPGEYGWEQFATLIADIDYFTSPIGRFMMRLTSR